MRKPLSVLASLACLAACAAPAAAPRTTAVSAASAQTRAAARAVTERDAPQGTLAFGTAFTWDDGVQLTVGKPTSFKPSKVAAGTDRFTSFVAYDVRVTNGTAKPLDAILITSRATTGERQSNRVFDRGVDVPTAKILPGRSLRWREAYGVVRGQPFVVTFQSGVTGAQPMFEFVP